MQINVLLFGPQAQLAGKRELRVHLQEEPVTAGAVIEAIRTLEPQLEPSLRTSRLAVNHEFAANEQSVAPGDEVALIGMVSGG